MFVEQPWQPSGSLGTEWKFCDIWWYFSLFIQLLVSSYQLSKIFLSYSWHSGVTINNLSHWSLICLSLYYSVVVMTSKVYVINPTVIHSKEFFSSELSYRHLVWLSLRKWYRLSGNNNKSRLKNDYCNYQFIYIMKDICLVRKWVSRSEALCNVQPQWVSGMKSTTNTCIVAAMHSHGWVIVCKNRKRE